MSEERSRQPRGTPPGHERAHALDKAPTHGSGRPAPSKRPAREERLAMYCEIDGLPAELERSELGSAGAFVLTAQPAQVDSEVSIFLRIGEQRFEMTGHVVQSVSCQQAAKAGKKPGYALLFTNLPEGERKRISSALQSGRGSLRPRPSPPPRASQPSKAAPPPRASQPSKAAPPPRASQPSKAAPPPRASQPSKAPERPAAVPTYEPAELALLAQLKQELAQLEAKTSWAVLGVSQGADPERVRKAFFDASKRYHPHLFARYSHPEIKRIVTELFIAHKRAFTTMTKLNRKHA